MPRPVSWLPQLQPIRRSVSNSVRSHYDRRDLELLFKVQPRAAGKLLEMLPTVPIGASRLVERGALERFLDEVAGTDDVAGLLGRMRTEKNSPTRRKMRRLTRYDLEPLGLTALPDWLRFTRGRMEIDFTSVEQLVEGMILLSRILQHELDPFIEAYEPAPEGKAEETAAAKEMRSMFAELQRMEARSQGVSSAQPVAV